MLRNLGNSVIDKNKKKHGSLCLNREKAVTRFFKRVKKSLRKKIGYSGKSLKRCVKKSVIPDISAVLLRLSIFDVHKNFS